MTEIFAAAGSLMAAFASLLLVFLVLKQWKADALHRLHEKVIETNTQEALRTIFAAHPDEFLDPDDLRLRDAAETVLNLYDLIGRRVQAETIPRDSFLETEWPTILRVGQQLGRFIDHEAASRGTPYKKGFCWLVAQIRGKDAIVEEIVRLNEGKPKHPWTRLPTLSVRGLRGYRNSRPAVAVFIRSHGHMLFLKRTRSPPGWETPGGFLDDGEPPVEGAKREVKEETGFILAAPVMFDLQMGEYGKFHTLNLCYRADVEGDRPTPVLDAQESSDFRWFPIGQGKAALQDLPLAFPWVADAYEKLR